MRSTNVTCLSTSNTYITDEDLYMIILCLLIAQPHAVYTYEYIYDHEYTEWVMITVKWIYIIL